MQQNLMLAVIVLQIILFVDLSLSSGPTVDHHKTEHPSGGVQKNFQGFQALPATRNLLQEEEEDESDLMDLDEKRSGQWNKLQGVWGKRADDWNRLSGVWGKRPAGGWNNLQGMWGKRATKWNNLSGMWGKRGWNDMSGGWGKREAPKHWNNLKGMWGKRSVSPAAGDLPPKSNL